LPSKETKPLKGKAKIPQNIKVKENDDEMKSTRGVQIKVLLKSARTEDVMCESWEEGKKVRSGKERNCWKGHLRSDHVQMRLRRKYPLSKNKRDEALSRGRPKKGETRKKRMAREEILGGAT